MSEPIYNSSGAVLYPGESGGASGYRGSWLLTLRPERWEKAGSTSRWPLMQDVPLPDAKTGYVALGSYPDGYGTAAQEAGCPPYCEARDSFVRFYARAKPPDDIRVQITLLGNAGGAVVAGPVAGSGVRVDNSLTVAGAAADAVAVGDRIKRLEGYAGGYLGLWTVTLSHTEWTDCTDLPRYPHKCTAKLRAARETAVPSAVPALDSLGTAIEAGMATVCETKDGTITFWAEDVPERDILMQVTLLGRSAAEQATSDAVLGQGTLGKIVLGAVKQAESSMLGQSTLGRIMLGTGDEYELSETKFY